MDYATNEESNRPIALITLPTDVLLLICGCLSPCSIARLSQVCQSLNVLVSSERA